MTFISPSPLSSSLSSQAASPTSSSPLSTSPPFLSHAPNLFRHTFGTYQPPRSLQSLPDATLFNSDSNDQNSNSTNPTPFTPQITQFDSLREPSDFIFGEIDFDTQHLPNQCPLQSKLAPLRDLVGDNARCHTAILNATLETLQQLLQDHPVTIEGRVKSRESQLAKKLKKKLEATIGEPHMKSLLMAPTTELLREHLAPIVSTHWIPLYQTTLEHEQLDDTVGIRIIHKECDFEACYQILKTIIDAPEITCFFRFEGKAFKDYIKHEKSNHYQSLHSLLIATNQPHIRVEIQVRTEEMHRVAEGGSADHEQYKVFPMVLLELYKEECCRRGLIWGDD